MSLEERRSAIRWYYRTQERFIIEQCVNLARRIQRELEGGGEA